MSGVPSAQTFMGKSVLMNYATFPLYGIFIAQLYSYASKFASRDSLYVKGIVALLTVVETVHTAALMHFLYFYSIASWSGELTIFEISWSTPLIAISETLMVVLAHSFYIRRIYIMSKGNWWLIGFLVALLITRTAFSTCVTVLAATQNSFTTFHENATVQLVVKTSLSLLVVADLSVASTMVYYLYQSRSGIKRSDHLVNTLIVYIINSGFITVIFSFAVVLSFVIQKQELSFVGPLVMVTKLYANALLGSLNMRSYFRIQPSTSRPSGDVIAFATFPTSRGLECSIAPSNTQSQLGNKDISS
ncbi:hypothetical protein BXZ70DRAFT_499741 [Cristinia sonorae]|uniref:DUF6534 domain-containing protein n=1 Tax=Cristinia sonorae TaxID=1940300 RepID=A0A8K0XLD3_9AGAR|nr:hypothetical protein BXZ70DRAFT_499741 [Cristinia sonorae]